MRVDSGRCSFGLSIPNEAATFVVNYLRIRIEQFYLQVLEHIVFDLKLTLERTIRDASFALE